MEAANGEAIHPQAYHDSGLMIVPIMLSIYDDDDDNVKSRGKMANADSQ